MHAVHQDALETVLDRAEEELVPENVQTTVLAVLVHAALLVLEVVVTIQEEVHVVIVLPDAHHIHHARADLIVHLHAKADV